MRQNINRIDHVAWIVRPENQERYVQEFSSLFNTRFDGPLLRDDTGNCLWVSWEAGLEILAPYGNGPHAQMWQKRLDQRGEGFLAIVLGVANIEETRQRLLRLGYETTDIIEDVGNEPWAHKLNTFKEIIVSGETLNTTIAFGQIVYADGVIQTAADKP